LSWLIRFDDKSILAIDETGQGGLPYVSLLHQTMLRLQISSAGISRNNPSTYRCQRATRRIEQSRARAFYLQPPFPRDLKSLAGCVVRERFPKDYKITHCSLSSRYLFPGSVKWPYLDAEKYQTLNRDCEIWLENSLGRKRRSLLLKNYSRAFLKRWGKTINVRRPFRSRILDLLNINQEFSPVSPDLGICNWKSQNIKTKNKDKTIGILSLSPHGCYFKYLQKNIWRSICSNTNLHRAHKDPMMKALVQGLPTIPNTQARAATM
jgi:hypothetical protein